MEADVPNLQLNLLITQLNCANLEVDACGRKYGLGK